jgi:hypothetical protein
MASAAPACGPFFEHAADTFIGIRRGQAEGHSPVGQQGQRPALGPRWGRTTGCGDPTRCGLRIALGLGAGAWPFLQRRQPLCDKALARAFDRGTPHSEGGRHGALLPALSRFAENTGAGHLAGRGLSPLQQMVELLALIVPECHAIFFRGHAGRPPYREVDQTVPHAHSIHQICCDGVLGSSMP